MAKNAKSKLSFGLWLVLAIVVLLAMQSSSLYAKEASDESGQSDSAETDFA